jgi:hypothetical protein
VALNARSPSVCGVLCIEIEAGEEISGRLSGNVVSVPFGSEEAAKLASAGQHRRVGSRGRCSVPGRNSENLKFRNGNERLM